MAGSETTAEHRVQLYTPAYLQNGKARPNIISVDDNTSYGQNVTIEFDGVPTIDRVVLQKYAGSTHGNHFDQRQVVLSCMPGDRSTVCSVPDNSSVAPPGQYMVFILYQGVPSIARFVSLQLPGAGSGSGFANTPSSSTSG